MEIVENKITVILNFNEFDVMLEQGYGLTESCAGATITFPKEGNSYFGSVGTLLPSLEAKIISLETGRPLPPNQRGEVWLHGPCVMIGT